MKTSIFQIVLLIFLGLVFGVGILIFAGILPGFRAQQAGSEANVLLWGTVDDVKAKNLMEEVSRNGGNKYKITYEKKDPITFNDDLLEALASGQGPDLILAPHEMLFQNRNKILPLPLASLSERQFRDYFVDAGLVFKSTQGWLALPIAVDPLVLYYNKDIYTSVNLITPPTNWEEFVANQPRLTIFDNLRSVKQSAVSFGTSNNVTNFKDILSLLTMQVGTIPLSLDDEDNYVIGFSATDKSNLANTVMALDFYTQFANTGRSTYTWNRSLPKDTESFLAGTLANYFGLASELPYIAERNPHLNFDVAPVPRLNKGSNLTVGHLYGLAVLKNSAKSGAAFSAALDLALTKHQQAELSGLLAMAPVRRSSLAVSPTDPSEQVFYQEALVCRVWPDPASDKTKNVFRDLIDDTTSGRLSSTDSLDKAVKALKLIIDNSK